MIPRPRIAAVAALVVAIGMTTVGSAGSATGPHPRTAAADGSYQMFYDGMVDGHLAGGVATVPADDTGPLARSILDKAKAVALQETGPSDNRIDVVILGDGYTSAEMGLFHTQADAALEEMFGISPYSDYRDAFNVYRVDVASNDSGIDHDPTYGIYRDTAFDAGFWCNGTDRLICANYSKMYSAASKAPAVDYMVLLVNSTTYGGAGGPYTTVSAGDADRALVLQHENGHTIGGLIDEYFYNSDPWPGGAVNGPNCSTYDDTYMAAHDKAWFRWLGEDDAATGGLVGAKEGCGFWGTGIYRPTKQSIMRDLGYPYFNPPSAEALIENFFWWFDPIDDVVSVTPVDGKVEAPWVGDSTYLTVDWWVDGDPVAGQHGIELDLDLLTLSPGPHKVKATITDDTPAVRDEAMRSARMVGTDTFWVDETTYYCGGREATIVGTPDPDTIPGTSGNDVIVGLGGKDVIDGNGGNDRICGGGGGDQIDGGGGKDRIWGGPGKDELLGGSSADRLKGGGDDDVLDGEAGTDRANGGAGTDTCTAETTKHCEL